MNHDQVVLRIPQEKRMRRLSKNLSLQDLANRSQLSEGLLTIENIYTIHVTASILAIVNSLQGSFKDFFQDVISSMVGTRANGKSAVSMLFTSIVQLHAGLSVQFSLSQTNVA